MVTSSKTRKPFYTSLYLQVICGLLLGVAFGCLYPQQAIAMKPIGDAFIKLIRMLIAPVIFCSVTTGIAGMRNMKNAGRVGFKAILYFEVMTTVALIIGLIVVHVLQPGAGMHVDPTTLNSKALEPYVTKAAQDPSDFWLHIIPTTIFDAFAQGDILQILLVAILFALALIALGNRSYTIYNLIQQISDVLFQMVAFIVRLAPIGAFGAMSFTVGKYGIEALSSLAHLMLAFYATCILFIGLGLGAVMRACKLRLWPFLKYIKDEVFIVLGTSSSEAALPALIEKMIKLGCSRPVVSMVVPTGYSFNLDGTSIYLTMAAIFLAQATGTHLSLGDELGILGLLLLTSKGAAAVTGGGFIVLASTLGTVGNIPVESLALILGIDRFMSEARAITNLIGNGVATIVVSRWERAIDMDQAKTTLARM